MKLVSGELMSLIDKYTIEEIGIPGAVLMENAGKGVFNEFLIKFNPNKKDSILIVCGKGNNGGDGFVVARYLHNYGFENFNVVLLTSSDKLKGDALINFKICEKLGINILEIESFHEFYDIFNTDRYDFIFDAILGTGLKFEVKDFYAKIIDFLNNMGSMVISIDIPSGLHSVTGLPLGVSIKADLTCTFAYKKIGLSGYPGCLYSGVTKVVDISIPETIPFDFESFEIEEHEIKNFYGKRKIEGHKGTFGHVVIIGGSQGFTGAPVLSGMAALRSGTGLVTSIVPEDINNTVETLFIEGMTLPIDFNNYNRDILIDFINKKDALIIGPGLGTSKEAKYLFFDILHNVSVPLVIDADGLNILSEDTNYLNKIDAPVILTPHPGEMSRLLNIPVQEIQNNRLYAVKTLSDKYNVVVILKGYRTVIRGEGKNFICPRGSNALATAGSGDVLSGMVASFLAQGYKELKSASIATYIHGLAGEIAEEKKCSESVIARDIIDNLHFAFKIALR